MEAPKITAPWRKATFSTPDNSCVELAPLSDGGTAMRDSKLGGGSPVLQFTKAELRAFVLGVKAGEFDDLI